MPRNNRRRNVVIGLILVIVVVLLLLSRCLPQKATPPSAVAPSGPTQAPTTGGPATAPPETAQEDEVLTPATVTVPARAAAGAVFSVAWTGPDNAGDFLTIVKPEAPANAMGNYRETKEGAALELTAPMEVGAYEVRYVTGRTRTVLGRAAVEIDPVAAALEAAGEVVLGSKFPVSWTGPNNQDDYITIVPKDAPEDRYESYAETKLGSPVMLTAPTLTGESELRYVSGQGRKVLARRPIRVIAAAVTLGAPAEVVAGAMLDVVWTGPDNTGDYITVVALDTPDGRWGNYSNTSAGSPLKVLTPIMEGDAELRYMTGQGHRVLGRRPIRIAAAAVTLEAPAECAPGKPVSIAWTGPNNRGDYITVVPKGMPDGQYAAYTNTSGGSPMNVNAPKEARDAEVRYMTGQGNKVLARRVIRVVP